ncbi:MAG TPA: glycosyltransferase [Candidatus Saccharimonadales bacterium]|nr:glycosyltransferase [Candidatus Saccharimonadales bacterium]
MNKQLKVAIVHDWLIGGGAERVVSELHKLFPDAPIYTSYCSEQWRAQLDGKVITGFLQHWPFSRLRRFLPLLRIWWFSHLKFGGYDLVISSSGNGEAFSIRVPKGTRHVCYCHTPTHYYWRHYDHYLNRPGFGIFDPFARLGLRLLIGPLRKWDYRAAQRPDYFIANSTHIQADIKKYYRRNSIVIHPPVDVTRFRQTQNQTRETRTGFVTVGRQVTHKHVDIIVKACSKLHLPLTVVGQGPDHDRLVHMAGSTVTFVLDASDEEVVNYLRSAEAFLFASFDDFGITPVEALAAGTPVIAYKAGGALDYVLPGETGEFFAPQTAEALIAALGTFNPRAYSTAALVRYAQNFSSQDFSRKIMRFLNTILN